MIQDGDDAELSAGDQGPVGEGTEITAISDENGLATVTVSGGNDDVTLRAYKEMDGDPAGDTAPYEEVVFDVQVGSGEPPDDTPGDPSDGTDPNPNLDDGNPVFDRATILGTTNSSVTAIFKNTKSADDIVIEEFRTNFIGANGPGSSTGGNVDIYADGRIAASEPVRDGPDRTYSNRSSWRAARSW